MTEVSVDVIDGPHVSPFKQYRKKPVIIDAYQTDVAIQIETLEGVMTANPGDWIIRGVKGEVYPCKDDIFQLTYELV
jgi:hypothetical protein